MKIPLSLRSYVLIPENIHQRIRISCGVYVFVLTVTASPTRQGPTDSTLPGSGSWSSVGRSGCKQFLFFPSPSYPALSNTLELGGENLARHETFDRPHTSSILAGCRNHNTHKQWHVFSCSFRTTRLCLGAASHVPGHVSHMATVCIECKPSFYGSASGGACTKYDTYVRMYVRKYVYVTELEPMGCTQKGWWADNGGCGGGRRWWFMMFCAQYVRTSHAAIVNLRMTSWEFTSCQNLSRASKQATRANMMARNGEECFVSGGARGGGKNGRTDGQKRPDGTSRGTINLRPAVYVLKIYVKIMN